MYLNEKIELMLRNQILGQIMSPPLVSDCIFVQSLPRLSCDCGSDDLQAFVSEKNFQATILKTMFRLCSLIGLSYVQIVVQILYSPDRVIFSRSKTPVNNTSRCDKRWLGFGILNREPIMRSKGRSVSLLNCSQFKYNHWPQTNPIQTKFQENILYFQRKLTFAMCTRNNLPHVLTTSNSL